MKGFAIALLFVSNAAFAADIIVPQGAGSSSTGIFGDGPTPFPNSFHGQSWTATGDSYQSFGFSVNEVYGAGSRNSFPAGATFALNFMLFEGTGWTGNKLTELEHDPGPGHNGWIDFDVSDVSFTNGATYTAILSAADVLGQHLWMMAFATTGSPTDAYTGGTYVAFDDGTLPGTHTDAAFRALTERANDGVFVVPEPGALSLLIAGALIIGLRRRYC